ncbi:hypothetical protein XAP412_280002 [Xanthomonas phaseoli pv. phaseoli]|uniref:Uncharacterized protein n=1 Tax=Xanthomonas campestris pv. phaseoli TaxID=317013 RepID=A0AB38E0A6_XANCH|nr:hypothetical protein XAP412_280002 [Xanthomonas phaseoli pv. phaseoli]SON87479.1 hypothetical protein XAP7430_300002 [Xanthomonas phaseoli pv. phaseoli]
MADASGRESVVRWVWIPDRAGPSVAHQREHRQRQLQFNLWLGVFNVFEPLGRCAYVSGRFRWFWNLRGGHGSDIAKRCRHR